LTFFRTVFRNEGVYRLPVPALNRTCSEFAPRPLYPVTALGSAPAVERGGVETRLAAHPQKRASMETAAFVAFPRGSDQPDVETM